VTLAEMQPKQFAVQLLVSMRDELEGRARQAATV